MASRPAKLKGDFPTFQESHLLEMGRQSIWNSSPMREDGQPPKLKEYVP
jgi:hypothetical protein